MPTMLPRQSAAKHSGCVVANVPYNKMKKTPKENIDDFEKLGYFKYSKPEDMDELKKELECSIAEHKQLYTVYFEGPDKADIAKDFRFINCDLEELIEWQAVDTLHILSFSFEKMQLPFTWKTVREGIDEKRDLGFSEIEINKKRFHL